MRPSAPSPHTTPARLALAFAALALLLGALPAALAAAGAYHEDEKFGFKVRTPKGWERAPLSADEEWIAAKYISDKNYFYTDKTDGWTWDFKPDMTVITFIDEVVRKRGVEEGEDDDEDDGTSVVFINNPYKDYEDFLKRTYRGGGWFISKDEEGEHKGTPVRKLEIKVEKLTRTGPKRIVAWVFKTEEVDFAVQFELLEDSYKKLKGDVYACLKSFKLIPRSGGSLTPTTTGKRKWVDEGKMSPEERATHRKQKETTAREKAAASVPEGWTVKEIGPFLVLNHSDDKYAKKVVAHAEAVWGWLDKNFDYVGPGEYVPRPILRICKNAEEQSAYFSGTSWGSTYEIVTYKDTSSGAMGWSFEAVNRAILRHWFRARDGDLWWAFPYWLENGLEQVLGTARSKGKKIEFHADQWELEGLREAERKGEITAPRDLVMMTGETFYKSKYRSKESAAFLRFLLGSKSKKVKKVLRAYIEGLQGIVSDREAEEEKERGTSSKAPETEEEEEERFRKRREEWRKKETELLQMAFDKTFGEWSDKDWRKLDAAYFKSL